MCNGHENIMAYLLIDFILISSVRELDSLLEYDQLTRERMLGRAFSGFREGRISFLPTFKYDKGSDKFDSSGKNRAPAWTDRVLYRCAPSVSAVGVNGTSVPSSDSTSSSSSSDKSSSSSVAASDSNITNGSTGIGANTVTATASASATTTDNRDLSNEPMLRLVSYRSIDSRHSDHRPVTAHFKLVI